MIILIIVMTLAMMIFVKIMVIKVIGQPRRDTALMISSIIIMTINYYAFFYSLFKECLNVRCKIMAYICVNYVKYTI